MEVLVCYCLRCGSELGQFRNSWNGIGNTYFSPLYPLLTYASGFQGVGEPFASTAGSQIENCILQDINCKKCQTVLGLRCDSAPAGHLLIRDQLILRLSQMSVISELTGEKVKPIVIKNLPLSKTGDQMPSWPRRASTLQPLGHKASDIQSSMNANHNSRASMAPPLSKSISAVDLSDFRTWTQEAINNQQKDINRVSNTLNRVEDEMRTFKAFMMEIRAELVESRKQQQNQIQIREDLSNFSRDLTQLQDQVNGDSEKLRGKSGESLSKDIEIIISDMLQVSDKANEVDVLKMDLQNLKTQLKSSQDVVRTVLEKETDSGIKRFPRVEIQPQSLETTSQSKLKTNQTSTGSSFPHSSSPTFELDELEHSFHQFPQKRNLKEFEKPVERLADADSATPVLTSKRRKISQRSGVVVRFQSPGAEVIETLSSEHIPSQAVNTSGEPTVYNHQMNNADTDQQAFSRANPIITDNSSLTHPQDKSKAKDPQRRASMVNMPDQTCALSQDAMKSESRTFRRHSSVNYGRARDSRGFLLTPSGKVDGRSLRLLRTDSNKENETPMQKSQATGIITSQDRDPGNISSTGGPHSSERVQRANAHLAGGKHTRPGPKPLWAEQILPSIERDDDGISSSSTYPEGLPSATAEVAHSKKAPQRFRPDDLSSRATSIVTDKPFRCEDCRRGFLDLRGLSSHKRNSTCDQNEAAVQARKAKLIARERLVKETLEREMASRI